MYLYRVTPCTVTRTLPAVYVVASGMDAARKAVVDLYARRNWSEPEWFTVETVAEHYDSGKPAVLLLPAKETT